MLFEVVVWLLYLYFFLGFQVLRYIVAILLLKPNSFPPFFPSVYNELHQCKFMTDLLRSLVRFHVLNETYHFLSISLHFWSSNSSFKVQLGA